MMHTDERMIAQMVAEVVGSDELINCYFTNDTTRLTECLESKLGKDITSSFLGKTAINSRTRIMPDIQRTILGTFPIETSKFDLSIDYSQEVVDGPFMEPALEMESRVR